MKFFEVYAYLLIHLTFDLFTSLSILMLSISGRLMQSQPPR